MTRITLRRIAIFGAPIGLGALAAVHPMTPEHDLAVWNLIHALQIPLSALFGIGIMLLLAGKAGGAASVARMAIVPWVAFFAAYDGVAGLATGSLVGYAHTHSPAAHVVISAARAMGESPFLGVALPFAAVGFSAFVFGGAAIALFRSGASAYAATAIAVGGVVWTLVHPLIGTPAMVVFLVGAVAVEFGGRTETLEPTAATEPPVIGREVA